MGLLGRLEPPPLVKGNYAFLGRARRKQELVRPSVFSRSRRLPVLRYLDKSERLQFGKRRTDQFAADAVVKKVVEGDRKAPIVLSGMVTKLDLDARKGPVRREAQNPIGRALHHLEEPGHKLP